MTDDPNHTFDCEVCSDPVVPGQPRRPTDGGLVHQHCLPLAHTPQRDAVGQGTVALVFDLPRSTARIRVFEYYVPPIIGGGEWRFVDVHDLSDIPCADYDGVRTHTERGVVVWYVDQINTDR